MKIIATAGHDKFILECDAYELGRIMGEYSANSGKRAIGTIIPVSELYEATREIVHNTKELTDHSEKVLRLMSALAKFGATVGPIAARINEKESK